MICTSQSRLQGRLYWLSLMLRGDGSSRLRTENHLDGDVGSFEAPGPDPDDRRTVLTRGGQWPAVVDFLFHSTPTRRARLNEDIHDSAKPTWPQK